MFAANKASTFISNVCRNAMRENAVGQWALRFAGLRHRDQEPGHLRQGMDNMPIPIANPAPSREYMKCPNCGCVHFTFSREEAQRSIDAANAYQASQGNGASKTMADFERCFGCHRPADQLLKIGANDVPPGATLQPVVLPGSA